ncbi:uncharacterized protein LOC129594389 [Paramacrobiotus metropolitanus]|uniref:uncharacterized protein LOC129594389 n=1 Tax=Paramacrobiotus metropolitanus TaxID=2943436 RepID=UPI002445B321|nr:uncharacterized protein LOC129594389 [Paramacrobiotus metropolitanus]
MVQKFEFIPRSVMQSRASSVSVLSRSSSYDMLDSVDKSQQALVGDLEKLQSALGNVLAIQNTANPNETAVKSIDDGAGNIEHNAGDPAQNTGNPVRRRFGRVLPRQEPVDANAGLPAAAGYPANRGVGNELGGCNGRAGLPVGRAGNPAQLGGLRRRPTRRDGERAPGFQQFLYMKNTEQRRIREASALEDAAVCRARDDERAARDIRRRHEDTVLQQTRAMEDAATEARWQREDNLMANQRAYEDLRKGEEWDDAVYTMRGQK